MNILGGNIVTYFERNCDKIYDPESGIAIFGAWRNDNGGILPGTITVNNESIKATLADNFSANCIVSGTEMSYGNLNIITNDFTLGSADKRFIKL